jgi:hypothetical protein
LEESEEGMIQERRKRKILKIFRRLKFLEEII